MHLERFAAIKLVLSKASLLFRVAAGLLPLELNTRDCDRGSRKYRFTISSSQFFTIRTAELVSGDRKRFHFESAFCAHQGGCYTSPCFSNPAIQKSGFRAE
jgi:hypothetical protein